MGGKPKELRKRERKGTKEKSYTIHTQIPINYTYISTHPYICGIMHSFTQRNGRKTEGTQKERKKGNKGKELHYTYTNTNQLHIYFNTPLYMWNNAFIHPKEWEENRRNSEREKEREQRKRATLYIHKYQSITHIFQHTPIYVE